MFYTAGRCWNDDMTNEGYHLVKVRTFRLSHTGQKSQKSPNLEGNAFVNYGNSSGTKKFWEKKCWKSGTLILVDYFCDFAQCVKEVFVFGKIDLGFYWWEFIQPKAKLVVRFIFHMERKKKLGGTDEENFRFTAIPRFVRTSNSALSISAQKQILTTPRFMRIINSISAHGS